MSDDNYRTIRTLLASTDPDDLQRGLALVKAEGPEAGADRQALCELLMPLFFIDTFDHPEHFRVVEEGVGVMAGLGDAALQVLFANMETGDVRAEMRMAEALGRMGAAAIDPLIEQYNSGCIDPACRSFLLYALGKVKSPEILRAAPLVIDAAASADLELRHTATRAIGKLVESIPPGELPEATRDAFLARLQANLGDANAGVRSKAVRSLGKLARNGHLDPRQRGRLIVAFQRILGEDDQFEWDRAYVVRKEAKEALEYVR